MEFIFLEFVTKQFWYEGWRILLKYQIRWWLNTFNIRFWETLSINLRITTRCLKWGMKINFDKCKVLTSSNDNIVIHGELLENVNNFIYLGSSVPDTTKDIERRIALAPTAFGRLRKSIWSKRDILLKLKLRLYRALILPIATCASETWA